MILEELVPGPVPLFRHPDLHERFTWLIQGTTGRDGRLMDPDDSDPPIRGSFDLGLFGPGNPEGIRSRWAALEGTLGVERSVLARQVHGSRVLVHTSEEGEGRGGGEGRRGSDSSPVRVGDADGHGTAATGLLLAVTIADCVPVTLVAPRRRAVALAHAGWRGVADGIVESAAAALSREFDVVVDDLLIHAGPAICGECYEVGPEVHSALGLDVPSDPRPVDLRAVVAQRAVALGVPAENVTVSGHCTLCGPGAFFSHRGGDEGRQVGFVAIAGERRE